MRDALFYLQFYTLKYNTLEDKIGEMNEFY